MRVGGTVSGKEVALARNAKTATVLPIEEPLPIQFLPLLKDHPAELEASS